MRSVEGVAPARSAALASRRGPANQLSQPTAPASHRATTVRARRALACALDRPSPPRAPPIAEPRAGDMPLDGTRLRRGWEEARRATRTPAGLTAANMKAPGVIGAGQRHVSRPVLPPATPRVARDRRETHSRLHDAAVYREIRGSVLQRDTQPRRHMKPTKPCVLGQTA